MADCTDYILNRRCRIVARLCGRSIYDDSGECVATIRSSDVVRMRDDKILGEYVKGRFRERRSSPAGCCDSLAHTDGTGPVFALKMMPQHDSPHPPNFAIPGNDGCPFCGGFAPLFAGKRG